MPDELRNWTCESCGTANRIAGERGSHPLVISCTGCRFSFWVSCTGSKCATCEAAREREREREGVK